MKRDTSKEVFGLVIVGTLAAVAWWKAPHFDPYAMGFFTKEYVVPYPEMPRDLRIGGAVFAAISAFFVAANSAERYIAHQQTRGAG